MNIHIFGLGAVGSNILSQLVKIYPEFTYHGYDLDIVEERNMRTQAYFLDHIGKPKALIIGATLSRSVKRPIYKGNQTEVDQDYIKTILPKLSEPDTIVIDAFDNSESRRLLTGLPCPTLHVGFSPKLVAEIQWDENYTVPGKGATDVDICTLPSANPFIISVTSLATLTLVEYITTKKKVEWIFTSPTTPIQLR